MMFYTHNKIISYRFITSLLISLNIQRSEEHTSELQSLMRISYAVFCLKKTKNNKNRTQPKKEITNAESLRITHTTHKNLHQEVIVSLCNLKKYTTQEHT